MSIFDQANIFDDEIFLKIIRALKRLSKEVNNILNKKQTLGIKDEEDIVYEFDYYLEKQIVRFLRDEGIKESVFGEEDTYFGSGNKIILLDPLDGSNNAKKNLPFYATLISYLKGKDINSTHCAIVWEIPHNRLYFAIKGKGAYISDSRGIKRINLSKFKDLSEKDVKFIDITPSSPIEIIKKLARLGKLRHLGSLGLSICYVCLRALDVATDLSKKARVVDVFAPLFILGEAEGYYFVNPTNLEDAKTNVIYFSTWSKKIFDEVKRYINKSILAD